MNALELLIDRVRIAPGKAAPAPCSTERKQVSRSSSPRWRTWLGLMGLGALWGFCSTGFGASEASPPAPQNPTDLVRQLRSLKPGLKTSTYEGLRANFRTPPVDFRAMPLWVWKDELEWPRLKEALGQLKAQGMGGATRRRLA